MYQTLDMFDVMTELHSPFLPSVENEREVTELPMFAANKREVAPPGP